MHSGEEEALKLHEDRELFSAIIEREEERSHIRQDILEKDYYVTLLLKELSQKQKEGLPAYFKGGTALYMMLKKTNRFSEDIDLSVDTRGCSRSQNDRRLERATKQYSGLTRNTFEGRTNRSEVVSVYEYDPVTLADRSDQLQRFGKVKFEATSFTISEPVETIEIAPLLYDLASGEERASLTRDYGIEPFPIRVLTMERIFIDKLFAIEAYYRNSQKPGYAFEAAKHLYDLNILFEQPRIQELLHDRESMEYLLRTRTTEERSRLGGIPGVMPAEFECFGGIGSEEQIRREYPVMINRYVFQEEYRLPWEDAVFTFKQIHEALDRNPAWSLFQMQEEPRQRRKQKERDDDLER